MVDLVGIQSNIVKIDQLISRTSGHRKPLKPHSDRKMSHWNLDGGHLSYRLAPIRKLGPAVGYANISGSICSCNEWTLSVRLSLVIISNYKCLFRLVLYSRIRSRILGVHHLTRFEQKNLWKVCKNCKMFILFKL